MNWFLNLRTAVKLTLCFGICLAIGATISCVCISRMTSLVGNEKAIASSVVGALADLNGLSHSIDLSYNSAGNILTADSPSQRKASAAEAFAARQAAADAIDAYATENAGDAQWPQFQALRKDWSDYAQREQSFANEANPRERSRKWRELGQIVTSVDADVQSMVKLNQQQTIRNQAASAMSLNNSRNVLIALLIAALLISGGLAWFITSYITRSIERLSSGMT